MNRDLMYYARLLNSFNSHHHIIQGQQIHLLFLKTGVLNSTITTTNRLLQMYTRCEQIGSARTLFDEIPDRNCFTWNTLLEGYMKWGMIKESLDLFYSMPDKNDFSWNVVISGLSKTGELNLANILFNEMPNKNGMAWNSLIHGYAKNGNPKMALSLFKNLLDFSVWKICVDTFVLATVIRACADLGYLVWGRQIHARVIIDVMEFDSVLGSSLVNMYGKCGDLDSANCILNMMQYPDEFSVSALISGYANSGRMNDARRIFNTRSNPCLVLWNSIIAGYVNNGEEKEALLVYKEMCKNGVFGDSSTFASVLNACSAYGVLKNGIQMHTCIYKSGFNHDLIVATSLVDTYAKCGKPNRACELFTELKIHDTVLLNSIITIYSNSK